MEIHATITFSAPRPLSQDEGRELWRKADHLARKGPGVYKFSTSLDHDDLTGALDDIARWITDQVSTPVTIIGVEAAVTEQVAK